MHVIGEETSERLDVIPAQYRVIVTHRPKLACRACEKIVRSAGAGASDQIRPSDRSHGRSVLVAKYGWHLPLYRQAKMLSAQGIDLDRSTLAFWVGYAAAELTPLYERLKAKSAASAKLAVDETPVPVLDPGRGQDQDRLLLGDGARRPALGRSRSAGRRLHLCAGARRRTS